jgi:hypothetical protein
MANITFKSAPEFASIEAFVQFCMDDDKETFSHEDLTALNFRLRTPVASIRQALESFGLALETRLALKRTRGFTTSSNDRWFGPGSSRTHGGSGFTSQAGTSEILLAGR